MTDRPCSSRKAGGGSPGLRSPTCRSIYASSGLHLVCERLRNRQNQHEPARARNSFATRAIARFPSPARSPVPVS